MKAKTMTKRALALVLCVVMLVSCWVFTAPTANAATSNTLFNQGITNYTSASSTGPTNSSATGQYRVRIMVCEDRGYASGDGAGEFDASVHDYADGVLGIGARPVEYTPGYVYCNDTAQTNANSRRNLTGTQMKGNDKKWGTANSDYNTANHKNYTTYPYWCEWAQVCYKNQNGTGDSGAVWFNVADADSQGRKDLISSFNYNYGYFPSDDGVLINGFPTEFTVRYYETSGSNTDGYYAFLQVAYWNGSSWVWTNSAGGTTTIPKGTKEIDSTQFATAQANCVASIHPRVSGGGGARELKGTGTVAQKYFPKPQNHSSFSVAYSGTSTEQVVPKSGSTTRSITYTPPVDQYGVKMVHSIGVVRGTSTTDGLSQTVTLPSGTTTTATVNTSIGTACKLAGGDTNTKNDNKQTLTTTFKWPYYSSTTATTAPTSSTTIAQGQKTATLTLVDPQYTVTFKDENNNTIKVNNADTQSIYYGSPATAPADQTKAPDATGHYTWKGWDKAYNNITEDTTVTSLGFNTVAHNTTGQSWVDTDPDTHWKACKVCGYERLEEADHNWDEGTPNPAATCTEAGNITYTCTDCGRTKDVAASAKGHTPGTPVEENELAANCESIGGYDSVTYCTVCEAELSREHIIVPATGHNTDGAAWQSDGINHWKVCQNANCPHPIQEQSGHTFTGEGTVTKEPTCVEKGTKVFKCTVCSHDVEEDIDINPLGHIDPLDRAEAQAPSDGSNGKIVFHCSRCDKYFAAKDESGEYKAIIEDEKGKPIEGAATADGVTGSADIPSPQFNAYDDKDISYQYSDRGASLKLTKETEDGINTIQKMRFSGSVKVPENVDTIADTSNTFENVGTASKPNYQLKSKEVLKADTTIDDCILDFGFVYTQMQYIAEEPEDVFNEYEPDLSQMVIGGDNENIYQMSVPSKNIGVAPLNIKANSSTWAGVTPHSKDGVTQLTFNLLINVKEKNWKRIYAARTYIIYKYHGEIYTVYDGINSNEGSARAVWYVAKATLAKYGNGDSQDYTPDYNDETTQIGKMCKFLRDNITEKDDIESLIQSGGKGSDWWQYRNECRDLYGFEGFDPVEGIDYEI